MLLYPVLFSVILLERTRSQYLGVDSFATYAYSCRFSAWKLFFSQETIENSHVRSRRLSLILGDSRALMVTLVFSRRPSCTHGDARVLSATLCTHGDARVLSAASRVRSWRLSCALDNSHGVEEFDYLYIFS